MTRLWADVDEMCGRYGGRASGKCKTKRASSTMPAAASCVTHEIGHTRLRGARLIQPAAADDDDDNYDDDAEQGRMVVVV